MKEYWKKFAAFVDERNTRERVLIFATTIVLVVAFLNAVLLAPIAAQQQRITQQSKNVQAEMAKLAGQVQSLVRQSGTDPDAGMKAKLAELQSRQSTLQRQIEQQSAELVAPDKMASVLEKILANNPSIQLVEAKTLPRTAVTMSKGSAKPAESSATKPAAGEDKKPGEIYRHGMEVTLRGSYLNLLGYLKDIEALPVRMFWERISLSADDYPAITMKIVVYTISLDKDWLTV